MNTKKLKMNNSPHQLSDFSTSKIMRDVIIALCFPLIAGFLFFGFYALMIVAISVLSCVLFEYVYNVIRKRPSTIKDLSAIVTGLILGLNLPPNVPFYIPIIGGAFAIIIVKMLFGGLGKNFANPAATARVFLLLAYTSVMTTFALPQLNVAFSDFSTGSTYLSGGLSATTITSEFLGFTGLKALNLQLFTGFVGGSIGETSALAILIGFIYLLIRRVIDYKIPFVVMLTSAFFALIFSGSIHSVLPQLLSGGLLFGAVFMATDYASSPMTKSGKIIFAFGIGLITMLIRFYGAYPEGTSLAIVFMNLLVPILDRYIIPVRFGEKRKSVYPFITSLLIIVMSISIVAGGLITTKKYIYENCTVLNYKTLSDGYEITAKGYVNADDKSETDWKNGSVTLKVVLKNNQVFSVTLVSDKMSELPGGKEDEALSQDFLDGYNESLTKNYEITGPTSTYSLKAVNNCMSGAIKFYMEEIKGR